LFQHREQYAPPPFNVKYEYVPPGQGGYMQGCTVR
jgi:hypothetical protein